jgi:hypothetical protein
MWFLTPVPLDVLHSRKDTIVAALGRELLGFVWAITLKAETKTNAQKSRLEMDDCWTAAPMITQGPRKGEPA